MSFAAPAWKPLFACAVLNLVFLGACCAAEPLPASVDLNDSFTKWGLKERRQGQRPTCSVFTIAGALEFAVTRETGTPQRLSVEYLNWAANQKRRSARDGGFFSDLWRGFAAQGICTEQQMPYATRFDPAQTPSAEAVKAARENMDLGLQLHWIKKWDVTTGLQDDHFLAIKRTLANGWPVCGGFRWPNQERWTNNVLGMCASNAVYDGHSVLLVGYRDDAAQAGGGTFSFRNSSSGKQSWMPYNYARAFMNDAVWIEAKNPRDVALLKR